MSGKPPAWPFHTTIVYRNNRFYARCWACIWESQHYLITQEADEARKLHNITEHKEF